MNEPMECPACGEIALAEFRTVEATVAITGPYTFIVYECSECGHQESS